MSRRYPLHQLVHRTLFRRLAVLAVLLAVVMGGAAFLHGRHQAQHRAVAQAHDRIAVIRAEYGQAIGEGLAPAAAFDAAMDVMMTMTFENHSGRFAYAVFFDESGDFYAFHPANHPLADAAALAVGDNRSIRPGIGEASARVVRIEGHPTVQLVVPMAGIDGSLAAWVSGVFVLSDAAASALIREPLIMAGGIMGVIALTTLLLYPVILRLARRLASYSGDLLEANLEMMEVLGCAIAKRDSDTDAHNYRVTIYAVRLAEREGLSPATMQTLIKGGFLHDVGKIGIRDDILLKPGKLTDAEYAVMKTHVEHGLDIVGRSRWLEDALAIVGGHHEKYDGGGYPERAPGDLIPITARIFAIADVFDALGSARPYKDSLPYDRIVAILEEGRGSHFDPALLTSFLQIAPRLHAELTPLAVEELREKLQDITQRYFNAELERVLV